LGGQLALSHAEQARSMELAVRAFDLTAVTIARL
jgi:hypothetical protein